MNLEIKLGDSTFKNPLVLASGTFGYGRTYPEVINRMGALVTKGITVNPRKGNPPPRIWDSAETVVNSVGLENVGLEAFTREVLPALNLATPVYVNLAGVTLDDFRTLLDRLDDTRIADTRIADTCIADTCIAGFELNLSCPNVKEGGAALGQSTASVSKVTALARSLTTKPVWVKLTANFCDVRETARAAADSGADAVVIVNTFNALVVDIQKRRPFMGSGSGGLSGPAIKPYVLYMVNQVSKRVDIPVIASGGVVSGLDVAEYLLAGASLVQLGSVNLLDPEASLAILKELEQYCREQNVSCGELVGRLEEI